MTTLPHTENLAISRLIEADRAESLISYLADNVNEANELSFYLTSFTECMKHNNVEMAAVLHRHWHNHPKFTEEGTYPMAFMLCSTYFPVSVLQWLSTTPLFTPIKDDAGIPALLYKEIYNLEELITNSNDEWYLLCDILRGCQMVTALYQSVPQAGDDLSFEELEKLSNVDTPIANGSIVGQFLRKKIMRMAPVAQRPLYVIIPPIIDTSTTIFHRALDASRYRQEFQKFTNDGGETYQGLEEPVEVTRLLGPINPMNFPNNDDEAEDDTNRPYSDDCHPCVATGGCRMLYCTHYDNNDIASSGDDFLLSSDEEQLDEVDTPPDLTARGWFKGYCKNCLIKLEKPSHALRLAPVTGGWYGCFCIGCIFDKSPDSHDEWLRGSVINLLERFNPKLGIIERSLG